MATAIEQHLPPSLRSSRHRDKWSKMNNPSEELRVIPIAQTSKTPACLNRQETAIVQEAQRLARLLNSRFRQTMTRLLSTHVGQYEKNLIVLAPKRNALYTCEANRDLFLNTLTQEVTELSDYLPTLERQDYTITFDRKRALRTRYVLIIQLLPTQL